MVIFNSYVKLPEGIEIQMMMNQWIKTLGQIWDILFIPIFRQSHMLCYHISNLVHPSGTASLVTWHVKQTMRLEETHLLKGHWKKPAYDLETASPHHIQNAVYHDCLVDFNHLEKYWSMGRILPCIMETKKCLKPPTRWVSHGETK